MINSRFPLVSATHTRSRQQVPITLKVPLLPKLRGHFAEFLNHDSLDRLSILYLITCVGLGYGRLKPHADAFLGSIGSPNPPKTGSHHVSGTQPAHLTTDNPTRLDLLTRLPPKIGSHNPHNTQTKACTSCFAWLASQYQYGRFFTGTGISTRYPSTTPVGLALGPD